MSTQNPLPINRAARRQLDARMRRLSQGSSCGADCSVSEAHVLDGVTRGGDSGLGRYASLTAAVGQVTSIPLLQNAMKEKESPALLRRVSTVSALFGLIVTEKPKSEWYPTLAKLTSFKVAENTRLFAQKLAMDEESGLGIALSFALLQGALGEKLGQKDDVVVGWQRAMAALDGALASIAREEIAARSGQSVAGGLRGLGAINESVIQAPLSCADAQVWVYGVADKIAGVRADFQREFGRAPNDAEVEYYGRMKWCTTGHKKDNPGSTLRDTMRRIKAANVGTMPAPDKFPGGPTSFEVSFQTRTWWGDATQSIAQGADFIANWVKANIGTALDFIITELGKLGKQATGFLCSGFEKLFTGSWAPVGGVLCTIVKLVIGGAIDAIRSGFAILKALFVGLADFFAKLFSGSFKEAALALVKMVNNIVLILLAGAFSSILGVPLVEAELTAQQRADGVQSMEQIAAKLPPEFTIMLVANVIGVIAAPTPTTIAALAVALTPAISAILAPVLKRSDIAKFRAMTIAELDKGISVIIKIAAMVVVGVMSAVDVLQKFWNALQRYAKKVASDPGAELSRLGGEMSKRFMPLWDKLVASLKPDRMMDAAKAALELIKTLPDIIIAVVRSDPDVAEIIDTTKQIVAQGTALATQANAMWQEALKKEPTDQDKMRLLREQLDAARRQLDLLCSQYPTDARCQFPKEADKSRTVVVEKPVEKIVYVDRVVEKKVLVTPEQVTGGASPSAKNTAGGAGGAGSALALAAGGFLVGGPVGAVVGAAVGFAAGKK